MSDYIHGFTTVEEDRLYFQAKILESSVYKTVSYPNNARILEVGSGVGAQTQILLRRFPTVHVSCVDASPSQIARASVTLKTEIEAGRVSLQQADARSIPFASGQFDGAFLCWILEHVSDQLSILKETHRCLKPGAVIYCTEVMNATLFIWPRKEIIERVWREINTSQESFGGDPNVGIKVSHMLLQAGFKDIEVIPINYHFDNRDRKKRDEFLSYWEGLMLSAIPALINVKRIDESDARNLQHAFKELRESSEAVFSYCAFQTRAQV